MAQETLYARMDESRCWRYALGPDLVKWVDVIIDSTLKACRGVCLRIYGTVYSTCSTIL